MSSPLLVSRAMKMGLTGRHYYVTDGASGKLYIVNSNGTGYETLDLQKQGTADLGIILDQDMIIIPMIQDNKLEAYRITD